MTLCIYFVDMETLKGIIDAETLVKKYLFPATPIDRTLCESVLSDKLFLNSFETKCKLAKIGEDTYHVLHALSTADSKMAKDQPVELDLNLLFHLKGSSKPLKRIDGQQVSFKRFDEKYVMACTLSLPDCWTSPAWELAIKSVELYTQRKGGFELIILLRKRCHGFENYASLVKFLKPFHRSCIVIDLRDYQFDLKNNQVLVIDPDCKVLFNDSASYTSVVGSSAFPFTNIDVASLWQQCRHLKLSSLEDLLGVEPSHKVFRMLPGTDPLEEEHKCISEFQSKIVFLYTYSIGNHLALLYENVVDLRKKGVEFEIITAYVPTCDYHNPKQFLKVFSNLVAQHGLSWWVVPYDSSTYPRLRTMYAGRVRSDQLIVFEPKLDGDPHGLEVMHLFGQSMFPFTKKFVVEHVMEQLNQITLESLFEPINHLYKVDPESGNIVCKNKSVLMGKNVLVYFDAYLTGPPTVLDEFVSWYNSLQSLGQSKHNFEVVCVYLHVTQQDAYHIVPGYQFPKWVISPDDEKAYSNYVAEKFFLKLFKFKFSSIFAFGEDGKICSLCAHRLLSSSEAVTFPLNGDLRVEIFKILNDYFTKRIAFMPDDI